MEGRCGLPRQSEVNPTLVLHLPTVTIALCVEGGIGVGIEPLQGHHTGHVTDLQTHTVDGGQMTFLVDGSLSTDCHSMTGVAIVETHVREVAALGVVPTVEHGGVGIQRSVQVCVQPVQSEVNTMIIVSHTPTGLEDVQVVLLIHLRLCTVVVGLEDGGGCTVFVQGGIDRHIRCEGGQSQAFAQIHRRRQSPQCTCRT